MLERELSTGRVEVREVKVGFSWTTFFFGVFPALIRKDWLWALIMFIVAWLTVGFSWLIFPFFYNRIYISNLLKDGFTPSTEAGEKVLRSKNFYK